MLSYQHHYHAGSLADVHKHALLSVLLHALTQKVRGVTYMETHAGRGVYDLTCEEALKTGDAKQGIVPFLQAPPLPETHPYIGALARHHARFDTACYPGSPEIARLLLRPQDALFFMECHPQEFSHLRRNMKAPNVHIHQRDGYEGVWALSPPQLRRGLVLMDPSYEDKAEFAKTVHFATKLLSRWKEVTLAIWYPVLRKPYAHALHKALEETGLEANVWELTFPQARTGYGMCGTGFVVINTPFEARPLLDATHACFERWLSL